MFIHDVDYLSPFNCSDHLYLCIYLNFDVIIHDEKRMLFSIEETICIHECPELPSAWHEVRNRCKKVNSVARSEYERKIIASTKHNTKIKKTRNLVMFVHCWILMVIFVIMKKMPYY